jgi:hypothetical protein
VLQLPQFPAFAPVDTQTPERHCSTPASPAGHGLPLGVPHSLSVVLQTPLTQALAASVTMHVPPGTACPFGTSGWQMPGVPIRVSHHCPGVVAHSALVVHVSPHAPVMVSQFGPA